MVKIIRNLVFVSLCLVLYLSIYWFLYGGLTNPHLSFDEGGQFWLCKGLYHFSPINTPSGTFTEMMVFNRTWNMDPGGFSVIGFFWLKLSNLIIWMRILPLIFSVLCLVYLYKILVLVRLESKEALVVCLFFFLSNSLVTYSFTFRAYSMEMFGVLMILYFILKHQFDLANAINLIKLTLILNVFVWSRYGFLINVIVINLLIFFLVYRNKQFNFNFIKKYLLIIVVPLSLNFFLIYHTELLYHFKGQPVPMYQQNFTLMYQPFFEMLKANLFSRRGLPFSILLLFLVVNYKYSIIKVGPNIKLIFLWMILTHFITILFSLLGLYPWYIQGRWGLTLEFISLFSLILILVLVLQNFTIKRNYLLVYKMELLLVLAILIFNFRSYNEYNNCIKFLNLFKNSDSQNAIVCGYLTPQAKYHLTYDFQFKNLKTSKEILFKGINTIPIQPRAKTWILISNTDSAFSKPEFAKNKFKYKFIYIEGDDSIIEVL